MVISAKLNVELEIKNNSVAHCVIVGNFLEFVLFVQLSSTESIIRGKEFLSTI